MARREANFCKVGLVPKADCVSLQLVILSESEESQIISFDALGKRMVRDVSLSLNMTEGSALALWSAPVLRRFSSFQSSLPRQFAKPAQRD